MSFSAAVLIATATVPASTPIARCEQLWTVNAAKVKPGMLAFARRYFEAGWLPARREAIKQGKIAAFTLLIGEKGETGSAEPAIQLITIYANQTQFAAREANFAAIFATLGRTGPILVDGKTRADIFDGAVAGGEDYRERESARGRCATITLAGSASPPPR